MSGTNFPRFSRPSRTVHHLRTRIRNHAAIHVYSSEGFVVLARVHLHGSRQLRHAQRALPAPHLVRHTQLRTRTPLAHAHALGRVTADEAVGVHEHTARYAGRLAEQLVPQSAPLARAG